METPSGPEQLRERVALEHSLAHVSQRQGNRARYLGVRKNRYDLRRVANNKTMAAIMATMIRSFISGVSALRYSICYFLSAVRSSTR